jgi:hypothetical protein
MTNLDSNPLQTKIVDSNEINYIKHNRMLTEMIATIALCQRLMQLLIIFNKDFEYENYSC